MNEQITSGVFKQAMRRFASGVCVVAAGDGEQRRGMTISAFSSVSADPPLILVCINANAFSHDAIVDVQRFSVNILAQHQQEIAMAFAGMRELQGAQRFTLGDWRQVRGAPTLRDALQSLVCEPVSRHPAGSHTVLIGRVIAASEQISCAGPLLNYDGTLQSLPARVPIAA